MDCWQGQASLSIFDQDEAIWKQQAGRQNTFVIEGKDSQFADHAWGDVAAGELARNLGHDVVVLGIVWLVALPGLLLEHAHQLAQLQSSQHIIQSSSKCFASIANLAKRSF